MDKLISAILDEFRIIKLGSLTIVINPHFFLVYPYQVNNLDLSDS